MLDRVGAEKARATSIVRYAAGSRFPRHRHPGGEEILVLSGTFSDELDDYPAGSYLRNPPGSSHEPFSRHGAIIFVKLWQMPLSESRRMRIDMQEPSRWGMQAGRQSCLLFAGDAEQVSIERPGAGERLFDAPVNGAEILVLEGSLHEGTSEYPRGCWMRLPPGWCPELVAGSQGATLYLKTGHLGTGHPGGDAWNGGGAWREGS